MIPCTVEIISLSDLLLRLSAPGCFSFVEVRATNYSTEYWCATHAAAPQTSWPGLHFPRINTFGALARFAEHTLAAEQNSRAQI
jgi:hypothetical protein